MYYIHICEICFYNFLNVSFFAETVNNFTGTKPQRIYTINLKTKMWSKKWYIRNSSPGFWTVGIIGDLIRKCLKNWILIWTKKKTLRFVLNFSSADTYLSYLQWLIPVLFHVAHCLISILYYVSQPKLQWSFSFRHVFKGGARGHVPPQIFGKHTRYFWKFL